MEDDEASEDKVVVKMGAKEGVDGLCLSGSRGAKRETLGEVAVVTLAARRERRGEREREAKDAYGEDREPSPQASSPPVTPFSFLLVFVGAGGGLSYRSGGDGKQKKEGERGR